VNAVNSPEKSTSERSRHRQSAKNLRLCFLFIRASFLGLSALIGPDWENLSHQCSRARSCLAAGSTSTNRSWRGCDVPSHRHGDRKEEGAGTRAHHSSFDQHALAASPCLPLVVSRAVETVRGQFSRLDKTCHDTVPSPCNFPAKSCFLSFSKPRK
jgi:hypothetical protein